tara:strand:- start:55 stop:609 length:555 start_codon:yes stop_codon:yes gene_type:complete
MNKKFIIVDDFYDIAHMYHKSFFEEAKEINPQELPLKISSLLNISGQVEQKVIIDAAFNENRFENSPNPIVANPTYDWIGVIYLTLPPDCISKTGLRFYTHTKTGLDAFPNEYARKINGWQNIEDIQSSFNGSNSSNWESYSSIYVKYNRLVLFRSDLWHSYGIGFGTELNNSMMYQKLLIKNG